MSTPQIVMLFLQAPPLPKQSDPAKESATEIASAADTRLAPSDGDNAPTAIDAVHTAEPASDIPPLANTDAGPSGAELPPTAIEAAPTTPTPVDTTPVPPGADSPPTIESSSGDSLISPGLDLLFEVVGIIVIVVMLVAGIVVVYRRIKQASTSSIGKEQGLLRLLLIEIIEDFRNLLALLLVLGFFGLLVAVFVKFNQKEEVIDGIKTVMATVGALVGPVIGFYFANQSEKREAHDANTGASSPRAGQVDNAPTAPGPPEPAPDSQPTNTQPAPPPPHSTEPQPPAPQDTQPAPPPQPAETQPATNTAESELDPAT